METVLKAASWVALKGGVPVLAFFGVVGLLLTFALGWNGVTFQSLKSAYDSAPLCAETADISGCRFQGQARIHATWVDKSGNLEVDVKFSQLDGRIVTGGLDMASAATWRSWRPDDPVDAELWKRRLTIVAGVKTAGNPDVLAATNYLLIATIFGAATAALLAVFAWVLVLRLRWVRAREARLLTRTGGIQRLPLTQGMIDYLSPPKGWMGDPRRILVRIFVAAAVIPAIPTAIYLLNGWPLNATAIALWPVCVAIGGVIAWTLVEPVRVARRDLARGFFVREHGPYTISVSNRKVGDVALVTIGGRALGWVKDERLMSLPSAVGFVDYFEARGDLLQLLSDSEQVLWSLASPTHSAAAPNADAVNI
jgi:hypothetical protein